MGQSSILAAFIVCSRAFFYNGAGQTQAPADPKGNELIEYVPTSVNLRGRPDIADIALPSFDDEKLLFGDETAQGTAKRYANYGVEEVIISDGGEPMVGWTKTEGDLTLPAPDKLQPIDTTGAGDSFNAGYLATRLSGGSIVDAVNAGHALASRVIMVRGAIF